MAGHLSVNKLAALLDGKLLAAEHALLLQHVQEECLACQALYEAAGGALGSGAVNPERLASHGLPDWEPPPAFEEYRLIKPLGAGAMGQVFVCHDTLLDRPVAIKFIAGKQLGPEARERFLIEARAVARLSHPNVVAIYRFGTIDGNPYIVSELIRGQSLDRLPRPLPWEQVLRMGLDLARGLGAAHRRGILHRDIKPGNAIVSDDGPVKLLDFGLAKLGTAGWPGRNDRADDCEPGEPAKTAPLAATPPQTAAGALVGTPLYMGPELLAGAPASARSDVFALGALLYELLCGQPPFRAATLDSLRQVLCTQDAAPIRMAAPAVDARLGAVVDRCLRRAPGERPADGEAVCELLLGIQEPSEHAVAPDCNPYLGLAAFDAEHRALFFGRQREIRTIVERLRGEALVLVAGDSGAGKSSLCRAGVLPFIEERWSAEGRTWVSRTLQPGKRPLVALAATLAPVLRLTEDEVAHQVRDQPEALWRVLQLRLGPTDGVLLFIDQLEELLTLSEADEAGPFNELLGHGYRLFPGIRVLATVRGDFLTRLSRQPGWTRELAPALYLLPALGEEDLREAIIGPARLLGFSYESVELVRELAAAALAGDSGLPLLQFALHELWEHRNLERRVIPSAALHRIGGIAGTLERHADRVIDQLLPGQRLAARQILLRLVTPQRTRDRRKESALLGQSPQEYQALRALVDGRLVAARQGRDGDTEYELTHEALLSVWPTLRRWRDSEIERHELDTRIAAAAADWERMGKPQEALWGERQLRECELLDVTPSALPPLGAEFLATSYRTATRKRYIWRGILAALPVVTLAFVALGWGILSERAKSRQADTATRTEMGLRATMLAQKPGYEVDSLHAAIEAAAPSLLRQNVPPAPVVVGLLAAVRSARHSLPLRDHRGPVRRVLFAPDGSTLASQGEDLRTRLWDAKTGQLVASLPAPDSDQYDIAFSHDGKYVAIPGQTIRLWDVRTRQLKWSLASDNPYSCAAFSPDDSQLVLSAGTGSGAKPEVMVVEVRSGQKSCLLIGHTEQVPFAGFSPDGKRIATASADRTARLWDARTGRPLAVLRGHTARVVSVLFAPDRLITASDDGTARLWGAIDGRPLGILAHHTAAIRSAILSADRKVLLVASADKTAALWDLTTGRLLRTLHGHLQDVVAIALSADGERIATASSDETARLWDAGTGELLTVLAGHAAGLTDLAFSADGKRLATASLDGTVRLWHGQIGRFTAILHGHADTIRFGRFSPDGKLLLTGSNDGTARLWDGSTGQLKTILSGHQDSVGFVEFSPDGSQVVTASVDRTARLWEVATGRFRAQLSGHSSTVRVARFSPDGRRVASASLDGTARIWDTAGRPRATVVLGPPGPVGLLTFSPDSSRLLVCAETKDLEIWDTDTGASLGRIRDAGRCNNLQFAPDGRTLVTSHDDGNVRLWNFATGAPVAVLRGNAGPVGRVSLSPDGLRLATSGADKAFIWDLATRSVVATLEGHANPVEAARYSPDGSRIVTASGDRTARLWDARTGKLIKILRGHKQELTDAFFSPDGDRIATTSYDRTARIWNGHTGEPYLQVESDDVLSSSSAEDVYSHRFALEGEIVSPPLAYLDRQLRLACLLIRHQSEYAQVDEHCRRVLNGDHRGNQGKN